MLLPAYGSTRNREELTENSSHNASELLDSIVDLPIEACIGANAEIINRDADLVGLEQRSYETQVRLHLPSVPRAKIIEGDHASTYEHIRAIVLIRAAKIRQELDDAELMANTSLLLPKIYEAKRNLTLEAEDGGTLTLSFKPVLPSVGHIYQSRLHYLRSVRSDTYLHYGMYLPGAKYPLTYVAISPCDRPYMADSLLAGQLNCRKQECAVLTRVYGLPGLPSNLISLTIKHTIRALRRNTGIRLLLTAYNPLLGFTGAAFRASGFRPFALAPVSYKYTSKGEFTTRRIDRNAPVSATGTPPNVLTARGVDRAKQKKMNGPIEMTKISIRDYSSRSFGGGRLPQIDSNSWLALLLGYRKLLESAWSADTIHPSYLASVPSYSDPRGQCGVSSVWLARQLRKDFGVEATYCYGDLNFSDLSREAVHHHCWIEIGDSTDASRIVVDLTCDQADSVEKPVLSAEHDSLIKQGMHYLAKSRLSLDELPTDRVCYRFNILDDAVTTVAEMTSQV